jgi:hypothetical protein
MRKVAERRPLVVTLVGSSRFKEDHERAQREETFRGKIVLPMGTYGHLEGLDMDGTIKQMFDELHLRKIDISDEVLLVNPGGYVGPSTLCELLYASQAGKRIFMMYGGVYHLSPSVPEHHLPFWGDFLANLHLSRPQWVTT